MLLFKMIRLFSVCEKELGRVFGGRPVSTISPALKSRPSTVGIPAWAKAANKRRAQILLGQKKKTPGQMQAELRLADLESNKSDFFTTSRVGVHRHQKKTTEGNRMATYTNGEMLMFYHPREDYPAEHAKAVSTSELGRHNSLPNGFSNSLSESQIADIKLLQKRDPKLWTVDILSDMYKVTPLAIIYACPLNSDQQLQLEVEQDFLASLSDYEKKEYIYFKNNERKKQLRKITKVNAMNQNE